MTLHSMEYPFGQFRSPIPAVSLHSDCTGATTIESSIWGSLQRSQKCD